MNGPQTRRPLESWGTRRMSSSKISLEYEIVSLTTIFLNNLRYFFEQMRFITLSFTASHLPSAPTTTASTIVFFPIKFNSSARFVHLNRSSFCKSIQAIVERDSNIDFDDIVVFLDHQVWSTIFTSNHTILANDSPSGTCSLLNPVYNRIMSLFHERRVYHTTVEDVWQSFNDPWVTLSTLPCTSCRLGQGYILLVSYMC